MFISELSLYAQFGCDCHGTCESIDWVNHDRRTGWIHRLVIRHSSAQRQAAVILKHLACHHPP